MKRIIAILAVLATLALSCLPVAAASLPANAAVAAMQVQLDATLGKDVAGAAVLIAQGGQRTVLEGFGYADLAARTLVTPETLFPIGDLSSLLVAAAVWHAADRGVVSLDENIERYLPADVVDKLHLSYPVTLRQLLSGTAGFEGRSYDVYYERAAYMEPSLADALLTAVPRQVVASNTLYAPSPFGVALAALALECKSEQGYADYVTQNVLLPLGMTHTRALVDDKTELGDSVATGHVKTAEGIFTPAVDGTRVYSGLYPANGAYSTAADMEKLLLWLTAADKAPVLSATASAAFGSEVFKNGVFEVSTDAALRKAGAARGIDSCGVGFSASLWLTDNGHTAALVLTNTEGTALAALPATLCGATWGAGVTAEGELPSPKDMAGYYSLATGESKSFRGKFNTAMGNCRAVYNKEDNTLRFRDKRLVQIARGVFADADGDTSVAVVQFMLDVEGNVMAVYTAEGESYLPTPFTAQRAAFTVLLVLLSLFGIWFLLAGVFSALRYFGDRRHQHFFAQLPYMLAGLQAVFVLCRVAISLNVALVPSSFVGIFGVLTLLAIIGAAAGFLATFMASVPDKEANQRMARTAIMYLIFTITTFVLGLVL